jgi:hypothetical protein
MALDGAAFSPKEFGLAIQAESAIGTAVVNDMTRINVDSVEMPNFNLTQVLEARSGSSGRLADADDVFISDKGVKREITFSGICDDTTLPFLLQNATSVAESSDIVTVEDTYSPPELETGASSAINKSITIALLQPNTGANKNIIFPGCTITNFTITGDMGNESGRLRFSATAATGFTPSYAQAAPTVAAYGTTFYSLATLSAKKTIAGAADCVVQSFNLNIENPSEYVGQGDSSGNPESIVRSIPEMIMTMDATVKYDNNTAGFPDTMKAGTNVATLLCDQTTIANGSTKFGIQADNGRITSVAFNEANAMMVDVSTKFVVSGSTDVLIVHT